MPAPGRPRRGLTPPERANVSYALGVLLMKALPIATGARILRLAAVSLLGVPIRRSDSNEMAPVEYIPGATGNSAATISTPGLLKPFKSPCTGASRRVIATVIAPRNTTQIGSLSHTISANIVTSTINVSEACRGMRAGSDQIRGAQESIRRMESRRVAEERI